MSDPLFRTPYPDYDVLQKKDTPSWNEITREVVGKRLREVPERRFFDLDEWQLLQAVCERILPQPDRLDDPVPIAPWIDDRLSRGEHDGYRYADMPPDEVAWRQGLHGIEEESRRLFGCGFADIAADEQDEVLEQVRRGEVSGDSWSGMSPSRFFNDCLLRQVIGIYYSHPAAWSEIGFGGPASPRGYVRLGMNERDGWEAEERWKPEIGGG